MVDVSGKAATRREAMAAAFVELSEAVLAALPQNPKGNPLEVARFAGIQAAKQTVDADSDVPPAGAELCGCAGDGGRGWRRDRGDGGDDGGDRASRWRRWWRLRWRR